MEAWHVDLVVPARCAVVVVEVVVRAEGGLVIRLHDAGLASCDSQTFTMTELDSQKRAER